MSEDGGVAVALGRIEGKLDSFDERCDRMESTLELVRSHTERLGLSLAGCQTDAARRERRISGLEHRMRRAEDTSVVQLTGATVRWRTLATLGALLISLISAAAAITAMTKCVPSGWHHEQPRKDK